MIQKTIEHIKKNYQFLVIILIFIFLFNPLKSINQYKSYQNFADTNTKELSIAGSPSMYSNSSSRDSVQTFLPAPGYNESTNTNIDQKNRKSEQNYNYSIAVNDVEKTINLLNNKSINIGGFVVNSAYYNVGETTNGYTKVRIPSQKYLEFEEYITKNSLKIVNKQTNGQDLTDTYEDVTSKLKVLQNNKSRFEEIMNRAQTTDEILKVQNQIFNLQNQIDALVGQQKYIENISSSVSYYIDLSTDEYAFSYIPKDNWDIKTTYKQAVRSLVVTTRSIVSNAIWIGVYAIIWLPILLVVLFVYKKYWRKK